jgi:carboxylate-amine ligase
LPRTGIPERFYSYGEFERFIDALVKTGCIDNGRRVWWDLRPHPTYSTLEFRICDLPPLVEDCVTLAAVIQALCVKLARLRQSNLAFNTYRVGQLEENKWRAARWGVQGKLVDWGKGIEVPFANLAEELLEFVDDVVDDLGSRKEVEGVLRIAKNGTSADRQLARFKETGDLRDVVDQLLEETLIGVLPAGEEPPAMVPKL